LRQQLLFSWRECTAKNPLDFQKFAFARLKINDLPLKIQALALFLAFPDITERIS
jgi:hypothetical protein